MTTLQDTMQQIGRQARQASRVMMRATGAQKAQALLAMAESLAEQRMMLQAANASDVAAARARHGINCARGHASAARGPRGVSRYSMHASGQPRRSGDGGVYGTGDLAWRAERRKGRCLRVRCRAVGALHG